jgi:phosphoribosyl 1,2-cyclic phosphodiesterase
MDFVCLASSSSANCYFLEFGGCKFLIEAGLPIKKIRQKLNFPLTEIDLCLVTHFHKDHSKSMNELSNFFKVAESAETLKDSNLEVTENSICLKKGVFNFKNIKIICFDVEHDCEGSLGFIFQNETETFLFVNDCKFIKYDLSQFEFDFIAIECNYNLELLQQSIKNGNYYAKRVLDTHMSLENLKMTLSTYNLKKCKAIYLMHLSSLHADEKKMIEEVQTIWGTPTYVCLKNGGFK